MRQLIAASEKLSFLKCCETFSMVCMCVLTGSYTDYFFPKEKNVFIRQLKNLASFILLPFSNLLVISIK